MESRTSRKIEQNNSQTKDFTIDRKIATHEKITNLSVQILDRTFSAPEENLACDEALLDLMEEGGGGEVLRFWSSPAPFVVLGYSNARQTETHSGECAKNAVPILRRSSGGGTVLQGPGCLNYALILDPEKRPALKTITATNHFIMEHHRLALSMALNREVSVRGITDLALGDLKFSGNAQRRKRRSILFHGTFLLGFDLSLIERYLAMPSKEPCYRQKRPHTSFLMNLGVAESVIKQALAKTWAAKEPLSRIPSQEITTLVQTRYSLDSWNKKF